MAEMHERLKQGRLESGLSSDAVGAHFNISGSAVEQWEKPGGTQPKAERLSVLCELYNRTADWLIGRTGDDPPWLRPRHRKAAIDIAALPKPLQDHVLGVIEALGANAKGGLLDRIMAYDTNNSDHERAMDLIREAQRQHREADKA